MTVRITLVFEVILFNGIIGFTGNPESIAESVLGQYREYLIHFRLQRVWEEIEREREKNDQGESKCLTQGK